VHPGYCGQGLLLKGAIGKWGTGCLCPAPVIVVDSAARVLLRLDQREAVLGIVGKLFAVLTALVLALIAYGIYLEWNVKRWDARIDALCAANGGRDVATRVYETALAPETKEYFADTKPTRTLMIPERGEGQKFGPSYPYVLETRVLEVLNERDPSVTRYSERVVRVGDNKVLAERFGYQRAGGGISLWDPGETRNCPRLKTENRLDVRTFENHPLFVRKAEQ
jgi:hypothetical protein